MKKIMISVALALVGLTSCKKEVVTTTATKNTCNCYEKHEAIDAWTNSNGTVNSGWVFKYNTTAQPDLCEKATGVWIYSGKPTSQRYLVICN
jgi:hypothetical protein